MHFMQSQALYKAFIIIIIITIIILYFKNKQTKTLQSPRYFAQYIIMASIVTIHGLVLEKGRSATKHKFFSSQKPKQRIGGCMFACFVN